MSDDLVKQLEYWRSNPGHGPNFVDFEPVAIAAIEQAARIAELEAERDALAARVKELEAENARRWDALTVADEYLGKMQTPGTEPLNSLNQGKKCGPLVASVRNEAREVWAIVGNVMYHGMTVDEARAALTRKDGA